MALKKCILIFNLILIMSDIIRSLIDLYHSASMLSLRRIKSFAFAHGKPRSEFASGRGCGAKTKLLFS